VTGGGLRGEQESERKAMIGELQKREEKRGLGREKKGPENRFQFKKGKDERERV